MWKKEAHGREVTELRCIDMEQWFPSHGRGPNEGHESVSEAAGGSWKKAIIIIISYYTGRFFFKSQVRFRSSINMVELLQ